MASFYEDFLFGNSCVVGRKRTVNQDSADILFPAAGNPMPPLLVLADGMGGYQGGEIASQIVLSAFREVYSQPHDVLNYAEILKSCVALASAVKVPRLQMKNKRYGQYRCGCLSRKKRFILSMLNSRAYVMRDINIWSAKIRVLLPIRCGQATPEQARTHRKKNVLSMAINARRPVVMPVVKEFPFELNDILLLCSDGLWGVVNESFLWAGTNEFEPQVAAEKLVAFANASGGPDNISVLIARRKERQSIKSISNDETRD
jgi:protein phosphatase